MTDQWPPQPPPPLPPEPEPGPFVRHTTPPPPPKRGLGTGAIVAIVVGVVLVTALLAGAIIAVAVAASGGDEEPAAATPVSSSPVEVDTTPPSDAPLTGEKPDFLDKVVAQSFSKLDYKTQQTICGSWDVPALHDTLVKSLLRGIGDSAENLGYSDTEVIDALDRYLDETCP